MKETRHLRCVNGDKYKTSENVPYGGQTREEFTPLHDGNSDDKKNQLLKKECAKGKMLEYFGDPIEHGTANNLVTSVQKSWEIGKHHAWFQSIDRMIFFQAF